MKKQLLVATIAITALVAASCGDDDDDTAEPADTTASAGTTSPATEAPAPTTAGAGSTATTVAGGGGDCSLDTPLNIGFAADLGELGAFSDQPGSEAAQVM